MSHVTRSTEIVDHSINPTQERNDNLSLIRKGDGSYYGSFNNSTDSAGSDSGTFRQLIVTSSNKGITLTPGQTVPLPAGVTGCAAATHIECPNGDMVMVALYFNGGSQTGFIGMQRKPLGSNVYGDVIPIHDTLASTTRYIPKPDAGMWLDDGAYLYPFAYRPAGDDTKRVVMLYISYDNLQTFQRVNQAANTPLEINNSNGSGLYATEPGLYYDINRNIVVTFRTKDGFFKGMWLRRTGVYFDLLHGFPYPLCAAPAALPVAKYVPRLNKWIAFHNDPALGVDGSLPRRHLKYSISDTGLPNSYVTQPNLIAISDYNNGFDLQPTGLLVDTDIEGLLFLFTHYSISLHYPKSRFITYDMLKTSESWTTFQHPDHGNTDIPEGTIIGGIPKAVRATATVSFAAAGITEQNTRIIYKIDEPGKPFYVPGAAGNGITGFTEDSSYYIIPKTSLDLDQYLLIPL